MAWTEITRAQYQRDDLEYASDLRDAEWTLIASLLPEKKRPGRPRRTDLRQIMEAILHIVTTGCQWRQLPRHFPAFTTVQGHFYRWIREGRWEAINHILLILSREQDGRDATPSVGIIDSQSENGGPRGYDAGRKIRGRKRHIATATPGHVVAAVAHPANVQDRDGAPLVATRIHSLFPWLCHLIGDGGYAGGKLRGALAELGQWTIEIVRRSDRAEGFVVLPKRWIVERSFAWPRTLPSPHEGCRGNNLVIPCVVDDCPYPQSSAENKSNRLLIQALGGGLRSDHEHRSGTWRSFEAVEYATLQGVDWFNNSRILEPVGNITTAKAEQHFYAAMDQILMAA